MLASHVDGDDDGKFDEDEHLLSRQARPPLLGGFDFHFGRASEGQYDQRREKVSVKTKTLVKVSKGVSPASERPTSGWSATLTLPDYGRVARDSGGTRRTVTVINDSSHVDLHFDAVLRRWPVMLRLLAQRLLSLPISARQHPV